MGMSITTRRVLAAVSSAVAAVALSGGLALAAGPVAAATPSMNIDASGGDGTAVDHDGTQGSFGNAVQGAVDADGDQDVDSLLTKSADAVPQDKATNKMTK
jgi:hypothetical protein